jgi:hypothetical protein
MVRPCAAESGFGCRRESGQPRRGARDRQREHHAAPTVTASGTSAGCWNKSRAYAWRAKSPGLLALRRDEPDLVSHRLTYKRANHDNFHVHGYQEEGTTTTPFDMTVLNGLDRFHLAGDTIDRVPRVRDAASHVKQHLRDRLMAHRAWVTSHGEDMPEILDWRWAS